MKVVNIGAQNYVGGPRHASGPHRRFAALDAGRLADAEPCSLLLGFGAHFAGAGCVFDADERLAGRIAVDRIQRVSEEAACGEDCVESVDPSGLVVDPGFEPIKR